MSDASRRYESADDSLPAIEEAIRAAANYVVPSDNLRPRTLEAAREVSEDRRSERRLRRLIIVLLLCTGLSIPLSERLTAWYEGRRSPSATEMELHALDLSTSGDVGPHWGLFEAFSQLRSMQAARLGRTSTNSSIQFERILNK
jgi:hypothetical protein